MSKHLHTIVVDGASPYPVIVGSDIAAGIVKHLPERAHRVAVFFQEPLQQAASQIADAISDAGHHVLDVPIPTGEEAKTSQVATDAWEKLGEAGFTRTDCVVAVGGGATTDLAGFVAATWLRGIPVVHVPTTLLAMVDAAVGGKTGINSGAGKNLVGVIHPPAAVICDLDFLQTVAHPDYVAGLAEVVKAGYIRDTEILDMVEGDPSAAVDPTSDLTTELIVRAIQVKADVVADDLTESVDRDLGRQVLNYGHTFGHAIERAEDYTWRHGDAVSVGMIFAAGLSHAAGMLDEAGLDRHMRIAELLGLPTFYSNGDFEEMIRIMGMDKKARGSIMRFVVLEDFGQPTVLTDPDEKLLHKAFKQVS